MQDLIHLGLENSQGWRWHSLSVKPVSLLECPHDVEVPYIRSETLLFQLTAIVFCPSTTRQCEEPGAVILMTSSSVLKVAAGSPPNPPFLQAECVKFPHPSHGACASAP